MCDQPVVMAVATYRSKAAAERDFLAVWGAKHQGEPDHVAAAVVEKGADGQLTIDRYDNSAKHLAVGWRPARRCAHRHRRPARDHVPCHRGSHGGRLGRRPV